MNIRRTVKFADNLLPLPVFRVAKWVYNGYYENKTINMFRRKRDRIQAFFDSQEWKETKKLHIGCGTRHFDDMINIDYYKTKATDYVLDAVSLPFPENSVSRIETYHMVEHISYPDLEAMLSEWHRVMEPGAMLIIELPDFDRVVEEYLETTDPERTEVLLQYVFGSQRFESDIHYWGWNYSRLKDKLEEKGFVNVEQKQAQDYHSDTAPCLRIEAKTPE